MCGRRSKQPTSASPKPICCHCGERKASASRGLCKHCHDDRSIRRRYPLRGRLAECYDDHEPTEAELEDTIAEQRKNLPAWFLRDAERQLSKVTDKFRDVESRISHKSVPVRLGTRRRPLTA